MIGDVYLVRDHGGPGLAGWWARQLHTLVTLIKSGRHTAYGHVAVEVSGGLVIDAGLSGIRFRDPQQWNSERFSVAIVRRTLTASTRERFYANATSYLGRRYAVATMLAHLIGRRLAAWFARLDPETVICSELVAQLYAESDGYRFMQRLAPAVRLAPEAVRPRDVEWTTRQAGERWECVMRTAHGEHRDPATWHY